MKRTFTLALAAAATFAAASPAQAALTSAGLACTTTQVSPTASDCRGWYQGNLLDFGKTGPANSQAYKDQLDAVQALALLGFTWNGLTVVQAIGSVPQGSNTIDFSPLLSGKTVIGIHRGGGGQSDQSTAFFLWDNLTQQDKITLNLSGLSGANLYAFSQVPEPGTWMLMIGGIGLMGWQLRRRRQSVKVTYA